MAFLATLGQGLRCYYKKKSVSRIKFIPNQVFRYLLNYNTKNNTFDIDIIGWKWKYISEKSWNFLISLYCSISAVERCARPFPTNYVRSPSPADIRPNYLKCRVGIYHLQNEFYQADLISWSLQLYWFRHPPNLDENCRGSYLKKTI